MWIRNDAHLCSHDIKSYNHWETIPWVWWLYYWWLWSHRLTSAVISRVSSHGSHPGLSLAILDQWPLVWPRPQGHRKLDSNQIIVMNPNHISVIISLRPGEEASAPLIHTNCNNSILSRPSWDITGHLLAARSSGSADIRPCWARLWPSIITPAPRLRLRAVIS